MTTRRLCDRGVHEPIKAAIHGALLGLAGTCCAYNVVAWCVRRDRHLAVNAGVYGVLTIWEIVKVKHHLS